MIMRVLRVVALLAAAATLVLAFSGAILRTVGPQTPQSFNISTPIVFWSVATTAAVYAFVGFVLARRLPRHMVPWLFIGMGLCVGGVTLTWAYCVAASSVQPPGPGVPLVALVNAAILQPLALVLGIVLLFVFPDGRTTDTTSRRILSVAPLAVVLFSLGVALMPGSIGIFAGLQSPLSVEPPIVGQTLATGGLVATILAAVAGWWSLLRRFHASDHRTRLQIRWFLWAATVGILIVGLGILVLNVFPGVLAGPGEALLLVSVMAASALVPVACAISILRHRLYDIDRIISRTLVYGSLLAVIAGAYTAGLAALQRISTALTGEDSDLSIVLTTLVLAISFTPIKRRLEKLAERFKEEPEPPAPAMAIPDDAWVDAVAARVIERLKLDYAGATTETPQARRRPQAKDHCNGRSELGSRAPGRSGPAGTSVDRARAAGGAEAASRGGTPGREPSSGGGSGVPSC